MGLFADEIFPAVVLKPFPVTEEEELSATMAIIATSLGSVGRASVRASVSTTRSKQEVPMGASCPSITFSETPRIWSVSPYIAASTSISTISSKEHFMSGPRSTRLMPCRVMAMRKPFWHMVSQRRARWR